MLLHKNEMLPYEIVLHKLSLHRILAQATPHHTYVQSILQNISSNNLGVNEKNQF